MEVVTWGGERGERAGDEMRSDTHNINSAITATDPPNALQSTQPALCSQAHIVQPIRFSRLAKIVSNCPDHLKDTLRKCERNICSKIGTIDETERKNMPESMFVFLSTGFLDSKQKPMLTVE